MGGSSILLADEKWGVDARPDAISLRNMYLDMVKRSVSNLIYPENELRIMYASACAEAERKVESDVLMHIETRLPDKFSELIACRKMGRRTVSQFSHTMIGMKRLDNIQWVAEQVFLDKIPGDFVEAGVWRGGAVILMRALLSAFGEDSRRVWAVDSFQGLPVSEHQEDQGYNFFSEDESLAIDVETVRRNLAVYGFEDDRVIFLPGWFCDTLPNAPIDQIAVLRLDADLYISTMDALTGLYDSLSCGGFVIIDDYGDIEPCRKAVHDFRDANQIQEPILKIDDSGVFWRKMS